MSNRDASVTFDWGDGTYTFRLAWGEISKLQEACDAGPFTILDRLNNGSCKVEEIRNVILWGLVGGGKTPVEATKLVRLFVEDRPPAESRLTAYAILSAGCYGAPEEEIEKKSEAPIQEQAA